MKIEKMNKKKCRKYADPGLKIPGNSGLLYAEQIDYIVRTAVRIIDHHKVLVLYVYLREEAVRGDFRPAWTVFQGRDDFVTLARKGDGTTAWRVSEFEYLGSRRPFLEKCVFYTQKDEERVGRFFKEKEKKGFRLLILAQYKIQQRRKLERQRLREYSIIARMNVLPPIPRGLGKWAHDNIMPAYFFYDYRKGRKIVKGICSSCGKEVEIAGARHNAEGTCPHCRRKVTMKSRGRRGHLYDRETCQVIQKTSTDEVVIRLVKYYYNYKKDDVPEKSFCENARIFIRRDKGGGIRCDSYYYAYGGGCLTNWKKGARPICSIWQYSFEADQCGHVYCRNLPAALDGTPWQYCPVTPFYEHFREGMQMEPFLSAYITHPKLEHLVKAGFYQIASDLAYRGDYGNILDETQDRTHRILQVMAEDIHFLRNLDPDLSTLGIFQKYCRLNLKERQKLLLWQMENKIESDILKILEHMTPNRMMRYMDKQYSFLALRRTQYGSARYPSLQSLVSEYRDYLDMCLKQNYDMRNSFVLYPKDLQKSHDKTARRIKLKADARMRRDFKAAYDSIMRQMDFEMEGMKIVYPSTPDEIIAEGNALHHCVGGYVDRVAKRECIILFLRLCGEESRAFYTIEVKNRKVAQVRGMKNAPPTPEVQRFMEQWEKEVLAAPAMQEAV